MCLYTKSKFLLFLPKTSGCLPNLQHSKWRWGYFLKRESFGTGLFLGFFFGCLYKRQTQWKSLLKNTTISTDYINAWINFPRTSAKNWRYLFLWKVLAVYLLIHSLFFFFLISGFMFNFFPFIQQSFVYFLTPKISEKIGSSITIILALHTFS